MPMFHYEATNRQGKTVVGSMDARDEGAVRARLLQTGYSPVLIEAPVKGGARVSAPPKASSGGPTPGASAGYSPAPVMAHSGRRRGVNVSTQALGRFYRQMAASVNSGVPLTQALPSIRAGVRDKTLQKALDDIEATVAAGRPISEAMERHPRAFSVGHVGMVRAGEGAGFLAKAFEELAVQTEADWGVEAATKFNIILFVMKWLGVPFLPAYLYAMLKIVPLMQTGLATTDAIRVVGGIALRAVLVFFACAIVLNLILPLFWKLLKGTTLGDVVVNLTSWMPVVGARRRRTDAVKTLSALSSAMAAGVPSTLSWQLAAEAADTPRYREAMFGQVHLVRQGAPLPDLLAATRLFDADTVNMVRSGEVSGNMPEMLAQAVYYQREEAKHMANLTPWIIAVVAYFLILIVGAGLFIWMASTVYGGMIQKGLDM
ncbi:MAG TPA: type II secretion system F family protein [Armatimonadota bacterium]|jgi:MSHA biogenesis protein MshG